MRVKLHTLMAGPDGVNPPGSVIEVADAVGRELILNNQAERVDVIPARRRSAIERAAIVPTETTSADVGEPAA